MARQHLEAPVPALALRRAAAAAALGVSVDVFDRDIRDHLPTVRVGGVVTYPVRGLEQWLTANQEQPMAAQIRRAAA